MQDRMNTLKDFSCGLVLAAMLLAGAAQADDKPVFRCPGNLYTDALSAKEANDKGCKTLEGAPITVIQSIKPTVKSSGAPTPGGEKVAADEQKARDSDKRRILEAELRKEEDALAALQKQFNSGQPERLGEERNYQKYQDRVNELKAAVTRKQADVDALKRELANAGASK
jgi:predicted lipid-binding transport protein (Tim44 family)